MTSYDLQMTSYDLQMTSYDLPMTSYDLPMTSYDLQMTCYDLQNLPGILETIEKKKPSGNQYNQLHPKTASTK